MWTRWIEAIGHTLDGEGMVDGEPEQEVARFKSRMAELEQTVEYDQRFERLGERTVDLKEALEGAGIDVT